MNLEDFIKNKIWDLEEVFDILAKEYKHYCHINKDKISNEDLMIDQYEYMDKIKSLYLPKYSYLFEFIKNTNLKKYFIEYTLDFLNKVPNDIPNEDTFRNQYLIKIYPDDKTQNLFTYDFYSVIDCLFLIIKYYKKFTE